MYKNIWTDRKNKKIHIWDDNAGYFTEPISKYEYCYVKDSNGSKRSIFGDKVSKISKYDAKDIVSDMLFESDVTAENRFLIDNYKDSEEVSKNHITFNFDIEVESEDGFPYPQYAANKITSIAGYFMEMDKSFVLILDEEDELDNKFQVDDTVVMSFDNESQLLLKFFEIYSKLQPTILTGWNISTFDIPYLYNRTCKIINKEYANKLSPISIVEEDYFDKNQYKIAGVSILDYLDLYKNFAKDEQSSYSLENISIVELGEGKIKYEGSLDDLYKNDIHKFVKYNLQDVILVKKLDDKLDYIEIAKMYSHVGHIPYEKVYHSSIVLEGAALTYIANNNLVSTNKKKINLILENDIPENSNTITFKSFPEFLPPQGRFSFKKSASKKIYVDYYKVENNTIYLRTPSKEFIKKEYPVMLEFEGAYVKDPSYKGLHKWIFDLDLKSMYPFIIITLNISPETKRGRIYDYDPQKFIKNEGEFTVEYKGSIFEKVPSSKIRNLLKRENLSLSSNGIFYTLDFVGIVPTLLMEWSKRRDIFKNYRDDYGKNEDDDKYNFYDRKQHVQKILLNSLYGVLGLSSFRFYDVDNAEATTATGRTLIKFSEKVGNDYYNDILQLSDRQDFCLYCDTDSVAKDSSIQTIKYGDINVEAFFDKLYMTSESYVDKGGKKFIFPKNIKSLYFDETENNVKYGNIQYVEKHKVKKRCYKIKTKSGKHVKVTEDHSLMVLDENNNLIEKSPIEISKGDKVISF